MNAVFSILVQDEIKTHGHINWRAKMNTISATKLLICKLAACIASKWLYTLVASMQYIYQHVLTCELVLGPSFICIILSIFPVTLYLLSLSVLRFLLNIMSSMSSTVLAGSNNMPHVVLPGRSMPYRRL